MPRCQSPPATALSCRQLAWQCLAAHLLPNMHGQAPRIMCRRYVWGHVCKHTVRGEETGHEESLVQLRQRHGQKFRAGGIDTLSEDTGFKDYNTWGMQTEFNMWLSKACT